MSTETSLNEIGKSAFESIRDMVAALHVDYDRLEELRETKEDHDDETSCVDWEEENPEDAEELAELEEAAGDCESVDEAVERIHEDPLSLRIFGERIDGDWQYTSFEILLTTGGPAVRIMGELDQGYPFRAWLEVQDWGTAWTQYYEEGIGSILLEYCQQFCFE